MPLVAEHQPAHIRMQAVGADHQVEAPRRAALERHVDARLVLAQRRDRIAVDVLHLAAAGADEDLR
ncbi:hypothetical protein OV079_53255 [Nannocystis pusilla]|uniref:Uncharacterized protein n=1 Tax=Nannocystis pusilla TaxID=889268 RepID=A0A9X3J4S1_9BACT|nr:hypothetical protein [Nannocystis pusilla]MCY1014144.1 hypothetical protein [Nannocystis pusilla]